MKPSLACMQGSSSSRMEGELSPLATRLLFALKSLSVGYEPHPCGGFTTDDMEWRLGTAFTGEEALHDAMEELLKLKLIRYAGLDENDAIGNCYELVNRGEAA